MANIFKEYWAKTSQVNAAVAGGMVERGYGQVEPNHLSAQRNGQIYAQLPAAEDINILENGQFAKYDYANGVVNFSTEDTGEWMLVYNEIKLYRDPIQPDCEFAMLKDNYRARVYSPAGGNVVDGVVQDGADIKMRNYDGKLDENPDMDPAFWPTEDYPLEKVTGAADPYEMHYNEDPFHVHGNYKFKKMPAGTQMVPRLFKTNQGDIMTTNTIHAAFEDVEVGDILKINANGFLDPAGTSKMAWQIVKKYSMPDGQPGVKVMRIQ